MELINANFIIIILCLIVILSYLFSLLSKKARIPSVILLLATGVIIKHITVYFNISYSFSPIIIEILGTIGLIMIILEAGLELEVSKSKIKIVKNSFLAGFIILLLSLFSIASIIKFWLDQPFINSLIYALPLSIISSAIVIPSLHHLSIYKKEFLTYEASFSDILGILIFNLLITQTSFSLFTVISFGTNILIAFLLSFIITLLLLYILTRIKITIKFFLIFSILILIYTLGKSVHLPSLMIILIFGILINNWNKIGNIKLLHLFPKEEVSATNSLLKSLTAETSFIVRTFFFIIFGYSINIQSIIDINVLLVGTLIIVALLVIRFLYLKTFLKANVFPELFYFPRGLITILLFYKIPENLKLTAFNEGIIFYVVLLSSLIMFVGSIFYKQSNKILENNN